MTEKKSFVDLQNEKEQLILKHKLQAGNWFKHHSGGRAKIKEIVFDCKTNEPVIIYEFTKKTDNEAKYWLATESQEFCRPLEGFLENFKPADNYGFFVTQEERERIYKFLAGEI